MSRQGLSQSHCASGNSTPFEEMLQWWRAIGNTVSTRPARGLNLRPPAPETNASQLDQLAGYCNVIRHLRIQWSRLGHCLHWVAWIYLWFTLTYTAVRSHEADIIIVKRLIHGRINVARVRVEPRSCDRSFSKTTHLLSRSRCWLTGTV